MPRQQGAEGEEADPLRPGNVGPAREEMDELQGVKEEGEREEEEVLREKTHVSDLLQAQALLIKDLAEFLQGDVPVRGRPGLQEKREPAQAPDQEVGEAVADRETVVVGDDESAALVQPLEAVPDEARGVVELHHPADRGDDVEPGGGGDRKILRGVEPDEIESPPLRRGDVRAEEFPTRVPPADFLEKIARSAGNVEKGRPLRAS